MRFRSANQHVHTNEFEVFENPRYASTFRRALSRRRTLSHLGTSLGRSSTDSITGAGFGSRWNSTAVATIDGHRRTVKEICILRMRCKCEYMICPVFSLCFEKDSPATSIAPRDCRHLCRDSLPPCFHRSRSRGSGSDVAAPIVRANQPSKHFIYLTLLSIFPSA